MKEEYMKSKHFKKKIEDFKINKVMGRIRKNAKGPNPLSVKKKKDKMVHQGKRLIIEEVSNDKENNELSQQEPSNKKRERKRFKKVKNTQ